VTAQSAETGGAEVYLSDSERLEDRKGDWGFAAYVGHDHRATFVFKGEHAANRARQSMALALRDCTYIATSGS
jgi:hypothetical protein